MSEDVAEAALSIMRAPRAIRVAGGGGLPTTITHRAHHVASGEKTTWLTAFLRRAAAPTLVFVRTKRGADRLARRLAAAGIRCAPLHADRSQRERLSAVEGFRAGRHRALVATDLAARGLDIEGISHVINFDPPQSADVYVHRVGRTGRAAAKGTALTLITPDDERALREIEKSLNIRLDTSRAAATSVAVAPPEEGYLATA
jgi:ATP-dependent RNA helicase RhlE